MQWAALMMLTECGLSVWKVGSCTNHCELNFDINLIITFRWFSQQNYFFFIYRRSHAIARPQTTFMFMVLIFSRKVNPRKRNKLFAFVSFHHLHHDYCLFVFAVKCFDPPIHGGARYSVIQLYRRCSCVSARCLCEGNSRESMWTMFRGVSR